MHPPRENSHCNRAVRRGAALAESTACARRCRVCLCYTIWPTPIIRCCAAVGGSDALRMRHTPCGCRSAHLVEVRSNSRLPPVSTMRRAKQCRYFARSPPPSKRHSRLTIVRRGCKTVTIRRDSWRSHVHRTNTAQRVQSFKRPTANVGGRGGRPSSFSGGFKGGILFEKRIPPLSRVPTAGGDPHTAPAALQNSRTSVRCEKRSTLWNIQ